MTTKQAPYQVSSLIAEEQIKEGLSRQIFGYDDKVMMVKVFFKKDVIGDLHAHPHVQVSYVAEGSFEVYIGDETQILRKGDGFYIKPDTIHGVKCLEDGILVDVFNPLREDFIS
ncbi:cupin domain-containing protein [Pedobacter glucosidilyticus]|uniref:cupin domain-containing protein n=1 Tax=Pedobacter glucosidilyticus TaxID=1122941 RepID=UPI0003FD1BB2|nr:cupin domain-containing protein [Pedobacter glucosidilyticus]